MTEAFNALLLNFVLGLYPREWRKRYGGEVRELVVALSEEDRRSLVGMMPSLIVGATAERLHVLRRSDRAGMAAALLTTVVLLGGTVMLSHRVVPGNPHAARVTRRLVPAAPSSSASRLTAGGERDRSTL